MSALLGPTGEALAASLGAALCVLWVVLACVREARATRTPDPSRARAAAAYDHATRAAAARARARTR